MEGKIVVVGGGIAGLETALRLEKELNRELILIDPREQMVFYPTVHKIIEGGEVDETTINFESKFENRNINHIEDKLVGLDSENQELILEEESRISYGKLVLAFGAETNYFNQEKSELHCLRSIEDAENIRSKVEDGIDQVTVIGGGPTGVEAAASLTETGKSGEYEINLIQSSERILPRNSQKMSSKASKILEKKGVKVIEGERAENVEDGSVEISSREKIETDLIIWSAGIKKKDIVDAMNLPSDKKGLKVEPSMEVKNFEDIYAVGDAASYDSKQARAYHALSEAKTAVKNIKSDIKGGKRIENNFYWDPQVIYLGGRTAAMEVFGFSFAGLIPHIVREYLIDKRYMFLRKKIL
jgi:NADH dehydrogenase